MEVERADKALVIRCRKRASLRSTPNGCRVLRVRVPDACARSDLLSEFQVEWSSKEDLVHRDKRGTFLPSLREYPIFIVQHILFLLLVESHIVHRSAPLLSLFLLVVKQCKGNIHLLENDSLGVGGASERRETEGGSESLTLVVLIGPSVVTTSGAELASSLETSWLSFTCCAQQKRREAR